MKKEERIELWGLIREAKKTMTPPSERGVTATPDSRPSTGSEADEDYCIHCGAGPFRLDQLLTISPELDPYHQLPEGEDWEPVRACRPCYRKHYGEPPNVRFSCREPEKQSTEG